MSEVTTEEDSGLLPQIYRQQPGVRGQHTFNSFILVTWLYLVILENAIWHSDYVFRVYS